MVSDILLALILSRSQSLRTAKSKLAVTKEPTSMSLEVFTQPSAAGAEP